MSLANINHLSFLCVLSRYISNLDGSVGFKGPVELQMCFNWVNVILI